MWLVWLHNSTSQKTVSVRDSRNWMYFTPQPWFYLPLPSIFPAIPSAAPGSNTCKSRSSADCQDREATITLELSKAQPLGIVGIIREKYRKSGGHEHFMALWQFFLVITEKNMYILYWWTNIAEQILVDKPNTAILLSGWIWVGNSSKLIGRTSECGIQ